VDAAGKVGGKGEGMKPLSRTRSLLAPGGLPSPPLESLLDISNDYSLFTVPGPVADAIVWAARSTDLGRHNTGGGRFLLHAVQHKLNGVNDLEVGEDSIVLTGGGGVSLSYALGALCDPGDEVLVPTPGWQGFARLAAAWGAQPVPYRVGLDGVPDYEDLEALVEHDTKVLVVANPQNPTGAVLGADQLQSVVDFAREHDLYVLSDEASDMVRFHPGPALGPARFDTEGRVITVYSFARTHALAGLRLGYAVAAPPIADVIGRVQAATYGGPSALALAAGLAALTMDRTAITSMIEAYQLHRDIVAANLPAEVLPVQPMGGYFMVVDISSAGYPDADAFVAELLAAQSVKVAPGTLFGEGASQLIRLTLAVRERTIGQAVGRIAAFMGI